MAGLVPAIHDFLSALKISKGVDARDKPGHDGVLFERSAMRVSRGPAVYRPPKSKNPRP